MGMHPNFRGQLVEKFLDESLYGVLNMNFIYIIFKRRKNLNYILPADADALENSSS